MSRIASIPLLPRRSVVMCRRPVPIVATAGALVPLGIFALIFAALSGGSRPSVLAAAALLGGIGGVASLLVHELGHVGVARRLSSVRPAKVSLISLGAATHLEGSYRSGREQARMALGGPQASFTFALMLILPSLLPVPMWLKVCALALALLNVAIGVLSLLPVYPLDGHKLIVGLVWWTAGSESRARSIVRRAGFAFLALDVSVGMLLLAASPLLGITVAALVAAALAQKHLFRGAAGA